MVDNNYQNLNLDNGQEEAPDDYISGQEYREDLNELQARPKPKISWKQKLAVGFLAVFGIMAMGLWAMQFKSNLAVNEPLTEEESAALNINQNQVANIDTDGDGLLDYEEVYFGTSKFIEDSDSDGIDDKTEADFYANGDESYNPICPRGQNCFRNDASGVYDSTEYSEEDLQVSEEDFAEFLEQSQINIDEDSGTSADINREEVEGVLGGETTPDQLRALLRDYGMSEDILSQISDDELMDVYNETLQE